MCESSKNDQDWRLIETSHLAATKVRRRKSVDVDEGSTLTPKRRTSSLQVTNSARHRADIFTSCAEVQFRT